MQTILSVEKIEKYNENLSQAKTDVVMSSVFTGLYALIAAGSFLATNNPELFGAGMVIGTGASLVSTGYLALLVKKIRVNSLLDWF